MSIAQPDCILPMDSLCSDCYCSVCVCVCVCKDYLQDHAWVAVVGELLCVWFWAQFGAVWNNAYL